MQYEYGELNADGSVNTAKNTGNIAKQTVSFAGQSAPFIQSYRYDALDRLTEAIERSGANQNWKQTFGYDRFGNRTAFTQQVGTTNLVMDNKTFPSIDPLTNRITSNGYSYDLNGNLIQDAENRKFSFNADNKQVEVRDAANNAVIGQYFYDGDGRRVKKINGLNNEITVFVYDALGKQIAEYDNNYAPPPPQTSYTATDVLGSPRVITNQSGVVTSRRDFLPFGEELNAGTPNRTETQKYQLYGADNIRKRFTGYEKDTETGLDFAEARYYQNKHGRFTAVDPLLASGKSANPQTFNRYVYVSNNPIVFNDPSGLNANNPWGQKDGDPYVKWFNTTTEMKADGYSQVENHTYMVDGNYVVLDPNSNNLLVTPDRRAAMGKHFVYNGFPWYIEYTPASPVFYTVAHNMSGDPLSALGSFGAGAATEGVMGGVGKFFFGGAKAASTIGKSVIGTTKGVGEAAAEKEGFKLAVGLADSTGSPLFQFAEKTGSTTYFHRFGRTFIPSRFEQLATEATEINFNFGGKFSITNYANWQRAGRPDGFKMITNYELDHILSNPNLLRKTNFHVYPEIP